MKMKVAVSKVSNFPFFCIVVFQISITILSYTMYKFSRILLCFYLSNMQLFQISISCIVFTSFAQFEYQCKMKKSSAIAILFNDI